MNIVQDYVFRQALGPLLAVLGALAAIAILTQGLNRLDIIVDNRQSAMAVVWVTLLATPQLISLILPLAVFFAVAFAINRMNVESETTVLYAAGFSAWRLSQPVIMLACVAALAHLWVTTVIQPAASTEMRETIYDIRADVASTLVREGDYTFPAEGLTMYARERAPGGEMRDLFVHDARQSPAVTYTARSGLITMANGTPQLVMIDGQIQRQSDAGAVETLDFDRYPLILNELVETETDLVLKPGDRTLAQLFFPDMTNHYDQRNVNRLTAEGHYRLAAPLLNIALAMIALASLLGGEFSRQGYLGRLLWASGVALLVRLLALGLQAAAVDEPALNVAQYGFPLLVSGGAAALLLRAGRRKTREGPAAFAPA